MQLQSTSRSAPAQARRRIGYAKLVRLEREKRRQALTDAFVKEQCGIVAHAAGPFRVDDALFAAAIRDMITLRGPNRCGPSRRGTAAHEAGHFVTAHVEGRNPYNAMIAGSAFNHAGYTGEVWLSASLADADASAPDLFADARTIIAGPVAEQLLGEGLAIHNIAELMTARACVSRAALMAGLNREESWSLAVKETLDLLLLHEHAVYEIAALLERRGTIRCTDRSAKRAIEQLSSANHQAINLLEMSNGARSILRSLANVPDVLQQVPHP